ncbi:MAG: DUF2062 domain-containing protein [Gammaproteobacteria bacterium]
MLIKFLKKYLPDHKSINQKPFMKFFGRALHQPNLWRLNRASVSRAIGIGLFCAFIPIPPQIVLSSICAIIFNSNLPLTFIVSLLTNPLTAAPLFYFAYKVGSFLLEIQPTPFDGTIGWFSNNFSNIAMPFLLGCFVVGAISGALGYVLVRIVWYLSTVIRWRRRRSLLANRENILPEKKKSSDQRKN